MGLEIVVVTAERVELVEAGVTGLAPFLAVVVLEPLGAGATFVRALRSQPPQRDLLGHGRRAAEVRDVDHVDPLVITSLRIASPSSSRATETGMGPSPTISQTSSPSTDPRRSAVWSILMIPRYCAGVAFGLPFAFGWSLRRRVGVGLGGCGGVSAGGAVRGAAGELDERVERVRLVRLAAALGPGGFEHLVHDRPMRGPERGARLDRARGRSRSRRLRRR